MLLRITTINILFSTTFFFFGCESSSDENLFTTLESKKERAKDLNISKKSLSTLSFNNNKFAFSLLEKLYASEQGNVSFSPYALSQSLAELSLGVDTQSKKEISTVCHFDINNNQQFHKAFNALDAQLTYVDANYSFNRFSTIWLQENTVVKNNYMDEIKVNYGSNIRTINFEKDSKNSKEVINTWTKVETDGQVANIIPKKHIEINEKFVVTNTVSFKSSWFSSFSKEKISNAIFTNLDGTEVETTFMSQGGDDCTNYPYYQGEDYQLLDLGLSSSLLDKNKKYYKRSKMLIILPNEGKMDAVLNNIASIYSEKKNNLVIKNVIISLPKLKFSLASYDMKKHLKAMGINKIFEKNNHFNLMSKDEDLKIDSFFHKTSLLMDEVGINIDKEFTAGIMACEGYSDWIDFRANRPFIVMIYDERTEQILFIEIYKEAQ